MQRRVTALVFLVACGISAAWFVLFRTNSLEDPYITFRYARHLADGFGYGAWNLDGTRVDAVGNGSRHEP
jgi:hypothetical protein